MLTRISQIKIFRKYNLNNKDAEIILEIYFLSIKSQDSKIDKYFTPS